MPTPRIVLLGLAAAALAVPATAAAAPHWSAPDIVFPADPTAQAAPSILMDPSGRAIAVSTDARGPVIATGDATGHFGAPAVVAPGQQPADGVSGALGPDGTLAVGWDVNGAVFVAVRKAGSSSFLDPAQLTPANGGTPALAVGPDGTVTAVWRERSGTGKTKNYAIKTVSFGPSGGSGDAQTFDAGTSPIDSPVAAAAPDGTAAIAWRRAAPKYRIRATVRPPGGTFAEPTLLDNGNQGFDTDLNLTFASDNTLAAGWANENGAFVALRPAGGAFGAPQQISVPGQRGYGLGLAGGPNGVLSAGWDGGTALKVADGGAAGFGAPSDIAPIPQSQVVTQVHLAYDAGSGLEAAWLDPNDSSIHTADRAAGGAFTAQRVGFGDTATGTVSLAAGPAGRATVLWRVRDGSVAAAVRSETADATPDDPNSPAVAPPPGKDTKPPLLTLRSTKPIKLGKKKSFTISVRCNEPCSIQALGRILLAKGSAPLVNPREGKPRSGTQKLTFKLGTQTLRQVRAILKRRTHVTARIDASPEDAASNTTRQRLSITLRR